MPRIHRTALTALALITAGLVGLFGTLPASAAWNSALTRYPYLTDVTTTSVLVTWADTYVNSYGTVTWGPAGGSCASSSAKATKLGMRFTVGSTAEYQHSITISGLSPDTAYCYRIKGSTSNAIDLLGTDPSPTFKTLPTSGTYSFLVFGDWGENQSGYNTNQAKLHALMASSGASFGVGTGDIAYDSATQNNYGDLVNTGSRVSEVFGPDYWRAPGAVLPFFTTPGNHGRTSTFFQIWPEPNATSESGESYQVVDYPGSSTLGYSASTGPGAWYAFNVAGTRFYVLTADWSDTNTGSADGALCATQFADAACPDYQVEADAHWKPGRPEYDWLATDLQANSGTQKLAFFHYPLRSDVFTEPSDPYLQNSAVNPNRDTSLEKLLYDNGVRLAFNGHSHVYQRNIAPPQSLVSYVTGGGGAKLTPIAKSSLNHCATTDAYGLGWSSTGGSYCGAAGPKPTSDSKVYHFLKVTVSGSTVTIVPTNADGEAFDPQTYDLGADASAPTAPGSVTATYVAGSSPYGSVSWTAATDDKAVTAYDVYRADPGSSTRTYLATVAPDKATYKDTTVAANTAYTYSVDSRDLAGNSATGTAPPIDSTAPTAPTGLTATATSSTSVDLSWTAATDSVGVTGYDVYRDTLLVQAGVTSTSYTDTTVAAGSTYSYTVKARDAAGNTSPASNTASVTTPPTAGSVTSTFTATADARVEQNNPTTNFGTSSVLGADLDSAAQQESYLRFAVNGLSGTVTSAKLRVWTTTGSTSATTNGPAVLVTDGSWSETGLTWNNRPPTSGAALDNRGALGVDALVEYDVTAAVTGNGEVNLKLMPDSTDGTSFNSRSGATTTKRPQLVVTTG
jgi:fibronectin type 3 domain-containing protein